MHRIAIRTDFLPRHFQARESLFHSGNSDTFPPSSSRRANIANGLPNISNSIAVEIFRPQHIPRVVRVRLSPDQESPDAHATPVLL